MGGSSEAANASRIAGIEATSEQLEERAKEEEKEREIIRIVNRKTRDQVMELEKMVEEASEAEARDLVG